MVDGAAGYPFLLAMAHDDGLAKMADIQRRLRVDVNYASQYRLRLIAAELVGEEPEYSRLAARLLSA